MRRSSGRSHAHRTHRSHATTSPTPSTNRRTTGTQPNSSGKPLSGHPALAAELAADAHHTPRRLPLLRRRLLRSALAAYSDAIARDGADADYATYRRAVLYGLSGDHRRKIRGTFPPRETVAEFPLAPRRPCSRKPSPTKKPASRTKQPSHTGAGSKPRNKCRPTSLSAWRKPCTKAGRWRDLLDVTSRIRAAGARRR